MPVRVAINGFGRIGRCVTRVATQQNNPDIELVAVNDLTDDKTLAHLLKYDSVHGKFPGEVGAEDGYLIVNGKKVRSLEERDPSQLPWKDMEIDVVLECTGRFVQRDKAAQHLSAGSKKTIISAPGKGDIDGTFCIGINTDDYDATKHHVISNASCTTNCLAPPAKVLHETFGVENGLMTTIHSYTGDQVVLDAPHRDLRRARACAMSMIPTTTGAAKAIGLVMPALKGKLHGMAIRVPTPNVSVVDLTVNLSKSATAEQINAAMREAAAGSLKGIMAATDEPLVSTDFMGDMHSSTVDLAQTMMIGDKTAKILAWYDNEMGYSARLWELCKLVSEKI
jgi:glyceraldehyde 3-phosphate dehydrogenase